MITLLGKSIGGRNLLVMFLGGLLYWSNKDSCESSVDLPFDSPDDTRCPEVFNLAV